MLRTDLRDRAVTIRVVTIRAVTTRAKAKVNHLGVGDTSELISSQGRERVSIATSLDILNGIVRRGRYLKYMGHHSPNHQWDSHRHSSFLLTPAWAKGTGVSYMVLHKHLLIHRWATWTKGWVEVKGMARRPGLLARRGRRYATIVTSLGT